MPRRTAQDARIVVTGASSGIGRAIAEQLGAKGAQLLLTARRDALLAEVADDIRAKGGACEWIAGDITEASHRHRITEFCRDWDGLDWLINNAGIGAIGRFDEADDERLRQVMEVNFFAPVELTRCLLPYLKRGNQPVLAIVGSVLSLAAVPHKSEYCASKFAIHGWAEALRSELKRDGVAVVELQPSTTRSEFFEHVLGDGSLQKSVGSMSPDTAARLAIRAIERDCAEAVFPLTGKALAWLRRWTPGIYRWSVGRGQAKGVGADAVDN